MKAGVHKPPKSAQEGATGQLEHVVSAVILSFETTLLNPLDTDGFTLKLNRFGKFYVRHRRDSPEDRVLRSSFDWSMS